ncbi:MAG: trypsin-like serine protease [Gemmatimonadetes bacterium]|nr:trypsin-like serine protease [Gemmatimonadota bacterium]
MVDQSRRTPGDPTGPPTPGGRSRFGGTHSMNPSARGSSMAPSARLSGFAILSGMLFLACGDDGTSPPPPGGQANLRPTANFSTDASAGSAPLAVQFDASASVDPDGDIVSFAWDFGDGTTGSGQTVGHTYDSPGPFAPRLTVTDDRGAAHTRVGSRIRVNSPPGTGSNDLEGTTYHDADASGARDPGEDPISNLIVFLDEDEDGAWDAGEPASVTDDNGQYAFAGLDGGRSYTVTQWLPVGWTNTSPGSPDGIPPLPSPTVSLRHILPSPQGRQGGGASALSGAVGVGPSGFSIIGGEEAGAGEFPFQVALVTTNTQFQFCGGTFIARSWVMTAAHCVTGGINDVNDPSALQVLAGTESLTTGGTLIDVVRILVHPNFSSSSFVENDIALLELDGEFMYPRVEPLARDDENLALPGTTATVIGWGLTSNNGQGSPVLKKLNADIISNAECQTLLGNNIQDVTICAGMQGSSQSVCNGDSGGPLLVPFGNRWKEVGIVSFGANICFQPTAFARVAALVDYVDANVQPERSGAVVVDWSGGPQVVVDFGNFR